MARSVGIILTLTSIYDWRQFTMIVTNTMRVDVNHFVGLYNSGTRQATFFFEASEHDIFFRLPGNFNKQFSWVEYLRLNWVSACNNQLIKRCSVQFGKNCIGCRIALASSCNSNTCMQFFSELHRKTFN